MAHHVYANNNEIASRSASGKSSAAFPDVCFSPPTPPASGVPVPYPNTCFAKDIRNGSRTVFIKGKEIAIEDKAWFKTSTGDEPATQALKKGIRTGKIKGKCYFQSWSPNVKVEGLSVDRHLDWVTHNHSNPPNAVQQKYISERMKGDECKKDRDRITKNCPEKKQQDADKRNMRRSRRRSFGKALDNIIHLPDNAVRKASGFKRRASNSWIDDYCDGLWVKPSVDSKYFNDAKEKFDELLGILEMDTMDMAQKVFSELVEMAYDQLGVWFLIRKVGGLAARSIIKNIVGGAAATTGVGAVVTAGMAAWTVTDFISTCADIAEKLGPDALDLLEDLTDFDALKQKVADKLQDYRDNPTKFMADLMTAQAAKSSCLRARKCMLVPYKETEIPKTFGGDGCCPGQTGHHVIPDSAMKGNPCYGGKAKAPTVCLEGSDNSHGSHGRAHGALKDILKSNGLKRGDPVSYEKMRDMSLDSIEQAILPAHCSRACLQKQLDEFYNECKNAQVKAEDGGQGRRPSGGGSGGDSSDF